MEVGDKSEQLVVYSTKLLSTYYVLDTILSAEDMNVNKTKSWGYGSMQEGLPGTSEVLGSIASIILSQEKIKTRDKNSCLRGAA